MPFAAIGRRLLAVSHAVIPDHAGDPEAVVLEDLHPANGLCRAMRVQLPPLFECLLIAPDGERQDLAGLVDALEALDGDD
ncbi:hypothetical protein BH23CHL1_BH23CHL1_26370 [soil metagenome]